MERGIKEYIKASENCDGKLKNTQKQINEKFQTKSRSFYTINSEMRKRRCVKYLREVR